MEDLGVLELLLDLGDDALSELLLLADLDLALISDPGIQDRLGFGCKSGGLLKLVCLGLELCGFLYHVRNQYTLDIHIHSTLETSKRALVTSTTLLNCSTLAILALTASVWSARAAFKMPLILLTCPSAHSLYIGPP